MKFSNSCSGRRQFLKWTGLAGLVAAGVPYLMVWQGTSIQDMGYTVSLDEIMSSPTDGWSPTQSAVAIRGHTYAVWTADNHYAKARVISTDSLRAQFDWAYQIQQHNPDLRMRPAPRGDAATQIAPPTGNRAAR